MSASVSSLVMIACGRSPNLTWSAQLKRLSGATSEHTVPAGLGDSGAGDAMGEAEGEADE